MVIYDLRRRRLIKNGEEIKVGIVEDRLIKALSLRGTISIEDICMFVYGVYDKYSESSMRVAISRMNKSGKLKIKCYKKGKYRIMERLWFK